MPRQIRNRRFWLNRPGYHANAHVHSEIELREDEDNGLDLIASFLIADCRRSATLDFDIYANATPGDRKNALRKARLLRDEINAFCEALEEAAAEQKRASRRKR